MSYPKKTQSRSLLAAGGGDPSDPCCGGRSRLRTRCTEIPEMRPLFSDIEIEVITHLLEETNQPSVLRRVSLLALRVSVSVYLRRKFFLVTPSTGVTLVLSLDA